MNIALTYDEQLQKLERICDETYKRYKFYDDEFEAETEEDFVNHENLIDKLNIAKKEMNEALFNYNTLIVGFVKNGVDLTPYFIRLGFSSHQIKNF